MHISKNASEAILSCAHTWFLSGRGQVVFGGEHGGHGRLREDDRRRPVGEVDGPLETEVGILRPRKHTQGAQVHQADHQPDQQVRRDQPLVQQVRRHASFRAWPVPLKHRRSHANDRHDDFFFVFFVRENTRGFKKFPRLTKLP